MGRLDENESAESNKLLFPRSLKGLEINFVLQGEMVHPMCDLQFFELGQSKHGGKQMIFL